jgi:hypothetical protein
MPCLTWHGIVTRPSSVGDRRRVRLRLVRWSRRSVEPKHAAPERDEPEVASPSPLVWEGRLPVVSSKPVRIAARRAAELAAEAPMPAPAPHATPDAA